MCNLKELIRTKREPRKPMSPQGENNLRFWQGKTYNQTTKCAKICSIRCDFSGKEQVVAVTCETNTE